MYRRSSPTTPSLHAIMAPLSRLNQPQQVASTWCWLSCTQALGATGNAILARVERQQPPARNRARRWPRTVGACEEPPATATHIALKPPARDRNAHCAQAAGRAMQSRQRVSSPIEGRAGTGAKRGAQSVQSQLRHQRLRRLRARVCTASARKQSRQRPRLAIS